MGAWVKSFEILKYSETGSDQAMVIDTRLGDFEGRAPPAKASLLSSRVFFPGNRLKGKYMC